MRSAFHCPRAACRSADSMWADRYTRSRFRDPEKCSAGLGCSQRLPEQRQVPTPPAPARMSSMHFVLLRSYRASLNGMKGSCGKIRKTPSLRWRTVVGMSVTAAGVAVAIRHSCGGQTRRSPRCQLRLPRDPGEEQQLLIVAATTQPYDCFAGGRRVFAVLQGTHYQNGKSCGCQFCRAGGLRRESGHDWPKPFVVAGR